MKKDNFTKNLMLHIRYPWTAICLVVMWIGLAVMCAILKMSANDVMMVICAAGVATVIIALVGFRTGR